jgi:hypothetical protein
MIVGVGQLELLIPYSHSLKEKRQVLRKIKERVFAKFKVTVAEVAHLDKWQRAGLGFSLVGNDGKVIESLMTQTFNFIDSLGLGQISKEDRDILYYGEDGD